MKTSEALHTVHVSVTVALIIGLCSLAVKAYHSDSEVTHWSAWHLPTAWQKAPERCVLEGTTAIKQECMEFLPKTDEKTGIYYQKIANIGACELYRTRYRGIYYIANTCGGLVQEPT